MIDVAFKYLFGTPKNKHLLKGLLENVFKKPILDITYNNTEQIGDSLESRNAYFDVVCKTTDGPDFIVECQVKTQDFFAERAVFYSSRMIANQPPKGNWDYNFRPVYFLGLINFPLPESVGRSDGNIHCFSLRNEENGKSMTDRVRYVFMEVGSFDKTLEECSTFEEKFLFFMKNLPTFVEKPDTHNNPYFEDLLMEAEYLKMDNETQAQYERRLMQIWDAKNVEAYMIKTTLAEGREKGLAEGREQGLAEGREKGLAEGRAEGREQGRAEGRAEAIVDTVKRFLAAGASVELVQAATGLSVEEIEAMRV